MWTMVGASIKNFEQAHGYTDQVLPKSCHWIQDKVVKFKPEENRVVIESGREVMKFFDRNVYFF